MPQMYLVVQGKAQLSTAVTLLMSVSRLHANISSPDVYWRKPRNRQADLELCHRNSDILEMMLNWIALSSKATRRWENFNNRETKMILSDELWSIANNSKSFANGSKSIIANNLGLYKLSDIYLIRLSKTSWI